MYLNATNIVLATDPMQRLELHIPIPPALREAVAENHKRMMALVVGGSVRDALLGHKPKDVDIEVYGATYDDLTKILKPYGHVNVVGKYFGVLKFKGDDGLEIDISIPRRETKTGIGHRDFTTNFDPKITPREAAARRDFTINALGWDPFTGELHDYYGGSNDLRDGILRATTTAFAEDPLRVLRGMQFVARFGMRVDPVTAVACRSLVGQYASLSRERVAEEWMKLAYKGTRPSLIWPYLRETGWISLYPQLENLIGVPQDPEWHPEGTVDIHTAFVMDAMAAICDREGIAGEDRAVLIFAALTHDFAKSLVERGGTTMQRQKGGMLRWTAHGHEEAGGPMARAFLTDIGITARIIDRVIPLVENHLQHVLLAAIGRITVPAVRRLADRLAPATIRELMLLVEADQNGRPPLPGGLPASALDILRQAREDQIEGGPPLSPIKGRDILAFYQNRPGPHVGAAVKAAQAAYVDGVFTTHGAGLAWIKNWLEKKAGLVRGEDVLVYLDRPGPQVAAVLKAAWNAQVAGEFMDRAGAERWLAAYFADQEP